MNRRILSKKQNKRQAKIDRERKKFLENREQMNVMPSAFISAKSRSSGLNLGVAQLMSLLMMGKGRK